MTDKELKKLSRLELLEILLEETKENEKLRAELEKANSIIENAATLSKLIGEMNNTLGQAQNFTTKLSQITEDMSLVSSQVQSSNINQVQLQRNVFPTPTKEKKPSKKTDTANNISDVNLYVSILNYYLSNKAVLNTLPADIQNNIRTRLRGFLDAKKQHTHN